jgi:hypothetical protein
LRREGSLAQPRHWRGWARFREGNALALAGNEADFNAFGGIQFFFFFQIFGIIKANPIQPLRDFYYNLIVVIPKGQLLSISRKRDWVRRVAPLGFKNMNYKNCAIYTRVSTDNQAEKEFSSCEAQEQKIRSFIASQNDWQVFKIYNDAGFSGATLERPALQELLSDLKKEKIDVVLVYKIDRLTRSPKDFYQLIEFFEQAKI